MTARMTPLATRCIAGVVSAVLAAGGLGLLAPAARADSAPLDPANPATPATVAADALPTVQINGVAWSQVVVGNTVYVAGRFSTARPAGAAPGTQETPRNNFLAYDIRTGELITSFAPSLNAQALAVTASPDGKRVYVAGDFTQANGQPRNRVAAYDTATGALVTTWRPSVSGQVRALAATNSTVYLGGELSAVGSVSRSKLAAVSATTGALLPWAPVPGVGSTAGNRLANNDPRNKLTSSEVMSLVVTAGGTQVVAAGRFDSLNGVKSTGIGALDAVTGATRPFAANQKITNQGINSAVYSLSLSADGATVYGTGYDYYGPGNLESAFAADAVTGAFRWVNDCRGDTYSSYASGGALYLASHAHDCGNVGGFPEQPTKTFKYGTAVSLAATGKVGPYTQGNANFTGLPAPSLQNWWPTFAAGTVTGQLQAGWSVTGNSQYVVYGGEFPLVNGVGQQGLVRFAGAGTAPNKLGPTGLGLTPTVVSTSPGTARVSWLESSDQDSENLTYRVYRDNGTTPVYVVTTASRWYDVTPLAFTDTGLSAGTHTYRIGVLDATGNRNTGSWTSVTVAAGTTAERSYAATVAADGATNYWSLGERTGTTGYDRVGGNDLTVNGGVGLGQAGAIANDADTGVTTNGSTTGFLASRTPVLGPQTFSLEAWFNTTTKAGGKIIGFGDKTTGASANYDRHVYLDTAGRVNFGVNPAGLRVVTSPTAYNDGRWHHVVGTVGPQGMALYVDGKLVGSRADGNGAQWFYGNWRIGGDSTWSGAQFFNGRIDEVAVYPTAMSAARVRDHYTAGSTGAAVNLPPTASFSSTNTDLTATLDGSASSDPDGTVAGWAWTFGDGTTGTGRTATHAYKAAGTYGVTLTVTDDKGATATRTASVTVTAPIPNVAPTADFTAAGTGLAGSFDASASKDPDGTIAGYGWDFGDGTTGTGVTASHQYGRDGTYPVTLTVTDDDGDRTSAQRQVTVSSAVLASDGFDRTVSGGLGTAEVGGTWTVSAGGTRQSVAGGAAVFALAQGTNTGSHLGAVSQTSADVRTTMSLSAVPAGGAALVYVNARRVAVDQEYRGRVRFFADGSVGVAVSRLAGSSTETVLGSEVLVNGLTYTAGTDLNVRVQAAGTGTTEVSVTVWPAGSAEPATPTVTRTDTTESLQAAGGVGLAAYLSGSVTAPIQLRFGSISVAPVGVAPPAGPGTPVETPAPADPALLASDEFDRTLSGGLGTAEVGGTWTVSAGGTRQSVGNGTAVFALTKGTNTGAQLGAVSQTAADVRTTMSLSSVPTGGGAAVYVNARRVAADLAYQARLRVLSDGSVRVAAVRLAGAAGEVLIGSEVAVPGLTYTPGTELEVRVRAVGTGTTQLTVTVWAAGSAEPATPTVSRTDTTAELQVPGGVGLSGYLSGSATAPVDLRFTRFSATAGQ